TGPVAITLTNPDGGTSNNSGQLRIDSFTVTGIQPTSAANGGAGSDSVAITVGGVNIPTTGTTQLQLRRLPDSTTDTTNVPLITGTSTSVTSSSWNGTVNLTGA